MSIPKGGRLSRRRLTVSRVNRILRARAVQARVAPFTAHDLRRALGGNLLDAGVDLSTVQKVLGHASPDTTSNHYDRRGERTKQDAAKKIHTPYVAPAQPSSTDDGPATGQKAVMKYPPLHARTLHASGGAA